MAVDDMLIQSISRLLKLVVRLLLRRGATSKTLEDLVRRIFVEVADRAFQLPNKKQSAARVSILTGVPKMPAARSQRARKIPRG